MSADNSSADNSSAVAVDSGEVQHASIVEATRLLVCLRELWLALMAMDVPENGGRRTSDVPASDLLSPGHVDRQVHDYLDNEDKSARGSEEKERPGGLDRAKLHYLGEESISRIYKTVAEYVTALREISEDSQTDTDFLCDVLLSNKLLGDLIRQLPKLPFQPMKDVGALFKVIFKEKSSEVTEYFKARPCLISNMIFQFDESNHAAYGTILRQCVRVESLCQLLMEVPAFWHFFKLVQKKTFVVASDAFATFSLVLYKHQKLVAKFLFANVDQFSIEWNRLIMSRTYVTKRQALKILRTLLSDRINFKFMMKYITSADNLVAMTELLEATSAAIRTETYHIFKIFVLNPRKTDEIIKTFYKHKDSLLEALENITPNEEVDRVIDIVRAIEWTELPGQGEGKEEEKQRETAKQPEKDREGA